MNTELKNKAPDGYVSRKDARYAIKLTLLAWCDGLENEKALEAEGRIKTLETEKNAISEALNKVVERSIQHAMDVVNRKIADI